MELSAKAMYGPVLKITLRSAHAQSHVSVQPCRKSFTTIVLGDHDFPLTASNFGNLTTFRAFFYRQHCAQRKPAGILFTQRPILSFFRPTVATRCTDGGEIWHGGGDRSQILAPSVQRQGCRTHTIEMFTQI